MTSKKRDRQGDATACDEAQEDGLGSVQALRPVFEIPQLLSQCSADTFQLVLMYLNLEEVQTFLECNRRTNQSRTDVRFWTSLSSAMLREQSFGLWRQTLACEFVVDRVPLVLRDEALLGFANAVREIPAAACLPKDKLFMFLHARCVYNNKTALIGQLLSEGCRYQMPEKRDYPLILAASLCNRRAVSVLLPSVHPEAQCATRALHFFCDGSKIPVDTFAKVLWVLMEFGAKPNERIGLRSSFERLVDHIEVQCLLYLVLQKPHFLSLETTRRAVHVMTVLRGPFLGDAFPEHCAEYDCLFRALRTHLQTFEHH